MATTVLHKHPSFGVAPNLVDYADVCARFSWERARADLDGLPGGGLNIAYEALDRHVAKGRGCKRALRWLGKDGEVRDFSYGDLADLTNRFANVLRGAGIGRGDTVFTLLGRVPELYVAVLGALRNGSVASPLFSVFGPEPIETRMQRGAAKALVTTRHLYDRKVAPWRSRLPSLQHVFLINGDGKELPPDTLDLGATMAAASAAPAIVHTAPDDMALLHFTSGTTGRPKGAIHVHEAVVAHYATGRYALDLHPDDVFWCTADPGWVTGTSYGIVAPLVIGAGMIVDEADFDAARWYSILRDEKVTVWYTAPTAIRMLMRAGTEIVPPGA
ncbi:MAG TPA: AMP-binding protein, partial [Stellaceae bacterium]|nr:AMP-binding protein [Stellaceae bacterium]